MINEDIRKSFGFIWPRHVSSLTQFLIESRRHFDGDLDLFLVLSVIGDRTFSARRVSADLDYDTWNAARQNFPPEDINAQSVSDFSGIPRETVRRKLNVLVDKGWVTRDDRGFIVATERAKQDLAPLTMSSLVYLSRMKKVFNEM